MPKTRAGNLERLERLQQERVEAAERFFVELYQQGKISQEECVHVVSLIKLHANEDYDRLILQSLRQIYKKRDMLEIYYSVKTNDLVKLLDIKSRSDIDEFLNDPTVQAVIESNEDLKSLLQHDQSIRDEMNSEDAKRGLNYGLAWFDENIMGRRRG